MKILLQDERYFCALLERHTFFPLMGHKDFKLYAQVKTMSYKDTAENPSIAYETDGERKEAINAAYATAKKGPSFWDDSFRHPALKSFVLFEKTDAEPKIIGIAEIMLPNWRHPSRKRPEFCGAHILSPYRGQGLTQMLYDTRLQYLDENTQYTNAQINIHPNNTPSIRAAKRNGFRENMVLQNGNIEFVRPLSFTPNTLDLSVHA